jgi:DNA replication and repair protein RecF
LIRALTIRQLRCIGSLEFEPAPEGALVFGGNAQGKTTLLEAICVLLRLRSPRTNRLHHLIQHGERGFRILGRVAERELDVLYSRDEKRILLDGAPPASNAEYLTTGLVTWMANDDLKLLHDGGAARRSFLDFLCAQLDGGYALALRNYRVALQQRNALLRERPIDWGTVSSFDAPLSSAGDELRKIRRASVDALQPFAIHAYREISGVRESLELSYVDSAGVAMLSLIHI